MTKLKTLKKQIKLWQQAIELLNEEIQLKAIAKASCRKHIRQNQKKINRLQQQEYYDKNFKALNPRDHDVRGN